MFFVRLLASAVTAFALWLLLISIQYSFSALSLVPPSDNTNTHPDRPLARVWRVLSCLHSFCHFFLWRMFSPCAIITLLSVVTPCRVFSVCVVCLSCLHLCLCFLFRLRYGAVGFSTCLFSYHLVVSVACVNRSATIISWFFFRPCACVCLLVSVVGMLGIRGFGRHPPPSTQWTLFRQRGWCVFLNEINLWTDNIIISKWFIYYHDIYTIMVCLKRSTEELEAAVHWIHLPHIAVSTSCANQHGCQSEMLFPSVSVSIL